MGVVKLKLGNLVTLCMWLTRNNMSWVLQCCIFSPKCFSGK